MLSVIVCGAVAFHAPTAVVLRPRAVSLIMSEDVPEDAAVVTDEEEAAPPPPPPPPPTPTKPIAPASIPDGSTAAFAELEQFALELNPLGYYDPLNLALLNFWNQGEEATIGFLRHAEVKHGRVAMAAFVGFMVHENGIRWPWTMPIKDGVESFDGLGACDVWDATPIEARIQILLFVGFLEAWSETQYVLENEGQKHYMKGGKPGYFPTFDLGKPKDGATLGWGIAHPVPFNLYDPFNFSKNATPEEKSRRLLMEVNNGRLAMIGIMGFVAEAKCPGAIPLLSVKQYAGEVMAPLV